MQLKDKIRANIIEWGKTIGVTVAIVLFLKATGLLSSVTYVAQSALLKTGIVNASSTSSDNPDTFDYNFTIRNLEGQQINFEEYRDKVIFINLWATWCGPCRAEMAGIQKLYDKVDKSNIQFVMLSIDRDHDKQKVIDYLQKRSFTFPVFLRAGYLTEQLTVPSIPTTFVVSKEGKIVLKEVGTTNFNTTKFKKYLEELAAQ